MWHYSKYTVLYYRPSVDDPSPFEALQQGLKLHSVLSKARPVMHKSILSFAQLRQEIYSELIHAEQVAGVKVRSIIVVTCLCVCFGVFFLFGCLRKKFATRYGNKKERQSRIFKKSKLSFHCLYSLGRNSLDCKANFPLRQMSMRHGSSNPEPHTAVLPHLRWLETPDMAQSVEAHRKLWGLVETLRQTADFTLLTGLKI